MSQHKSLQIKKPVAFWNRELTFQSREFFASLSKTALSGATLDAKGTVDGLIDTLSKLSAVDKPAQAAWVLIRNWQHIGNRVVVTSSKYRVVYCLGV